MKKNHDLIKWPYKCMAFIFSGKKNKMKKEKKTESDKDKDKK